MRLLLVWHNAQALVHEACRQRSNSVCKGVQRWLLTFCIGMILSFGSICANADTYIYLYDANGLPVAASSSYVYQDHYLYGLNNVVIGTVDENGLIFDANNHQIGYIVQGP